jgi:DNA repair protein RadA/Sms
LTEVQALVAPSPSPVPRRISHGFDSGRLAMLLAVLQRRARLRLAHKEVYVATVAGTKLADPGTDLAVALAVASAAVDQAFGEPVTAFGEVGLAGELRRVPGLERRLAEAARLGLRLAVVPAGSGVHAPHGMRLIEVGSVAAALAALNLRFGKKGSADGFTPFLAVAGAGEGVA